MKLYELIFRDKKIVSRNIFIKFFFSLSLSMYLIIYLN